ncbi:S-adenosyl-L-methionine-dependent methyltransferases superfamily protein [Hibiscus syriacus]|uniref:S-adenosyl-L-methionine-dependent methyltransferases superfamily protein n=1 Tax=Hibiscus syriacus TaxID=106335 RepID=A0A6A2WVE0_HIBSY|nr:S-adenosyl-L-methionine-dependent methyltransferases superfamily protein [Hibiscus syriacus]
MDEMYGSYSIGDQHVGNASPENMILPSDYQARLCLSDRVPAFASDELISQATAISEAGYNGTADAICRISSPHCGFLQFQDPNLFFLLLVGAPAEMARILDEILTVTDVNNRDIVPTYFGPNPELDEFMETYIDVLVKHKSDLSRPFDEATAFLNKIEMQLRNLCMDASITGPFGQSLSLPQVGVLQSYFLWVSLFFV